MGALGRAIVGALIALRTAHAATIAVPAGDTAALAAAIEDANDAAGTDTIELAAGALYEFVEPENIRTALPDVTSAIRINGHGATISRSENSPYGFRIITVAPGGALVLDDVTIAGGRTFEDGAGVRVDGNGSLTVLGGRFTANGTTAAGGAILVQDDAGVLVATDCRIDGNEATEGAGVLIRNAATATLARCRITENTAARAAPVGGGGVAASGHATITLAESTVTGNVAYGQSGGAYGGGLADRGGATWTIERSTIAANRAEAANGDALGGGMYATGAAGMTLRNSTVGGNSVLETNPAFSAIGGGLYGAGTGKWTLESVTLVNNLAVHVRAPASGADRGGGIGLAGGTTLTLRNTILASNRASHGAPECDVGSGATLSSLGYNLIEELEGCTVTPAASDLTGVDPLIEGFGDFGGATPTFGLAPTSGAIDAADPAPPGTAGACPAIDQRGHARPAGPGRRCDVGAIEFDLVVTTTTSITTTTVTTSTTTTTRPDCPRVTTLRWIACRMERFLATVRTAADLGVLEAPLEAFVTAADAQYANAAQLVDGARSGPARKALRRSARKLSRCVAKLRSRTARRAIPQATRDALAAEASALLGDVRAVSQSL